MVRTGSRSYAASPCSYQSASLDTQFQHPILQLTQGRSHELPVQPPLAVQRSAEPRAATAMEEQVLRSVQHDEPLWLRPWGHLQCHVCSSACLHLQTLFPSLAHAEVWHPASGLQRIPNGGWAPTLKLGPARLRHTLSEGHVHGAEIEQGGKLALRDRTYASPMHGAIRCRRRSIRMRYSHCSKRRLSLSSRRLAKPRFPRALHGRKISSAGARGHGSCKRSQGQPFRASGTMTSLASLSRLPAQAKMTARAKAKACWSGTLFQLLLTW